MATDIKNKKEEGALYLSIIIPAYNEAQNLPLTLVDLDKHLKTVDFTYEIIVVENGSTDNTKEIAHRFAQHIPCMRVIESPIKGKGAAVRFGMMHARGEIRLFMDTDNSTPIDQFFAMRPYFLQGYDVVIGSRGVEGSSIKVTQPWYRVLAGSLGKGLIRIVLLKGIYDSQCGFKAFTKKAAEAVFPFSTIVK